MTAIALTLAPAPAERRPRPFGDTVALTARNLRHAIRQVDTLLMSLILPVVLMLMFVYVFGGAISASGTGAYVDYVVPSTMILVAGYGASQVAVLVATDRRTGLVDRLRSMPVHSGGLLTAHATSGVLVNGIAMAAAIGVALLIGFSPAAGFGGWLLALGLVVLYTIALTWVAVWVGLVVSGPDAASGMTFALLFLPYVSSAFVPVETLPGWMQGFARHQPITPVVESVRDLLLGLRPASLWLAIAWCGGILLVARLAAGVAWRRGR